MTPILLQSHVFQVKWSDDTIVFLDEILPTN